MASEALMGWRRWLRYGVQGLAAVTVVSCLFKVGGGGETTRARVEEPVAPAVAEAEVVPAPQPPRTFDITPEALAKNLGMATQRVLGERMQPQVDLREGAVNDTWTIALGDGASLVAVFAKSDRKLMYTVLLTETEKVNGAPWLMLVGINMMALDPQGSQASRGEVLKALSAQLQAGKSKLVASGGNASYRLEPVVGNTLSLTAEPI